MLLTHATTKRGGLTASFWRTVPARVFLTSRGTTVAISTSVPVSKGHSEVLIDIPPDHFLDLARRMMEVDRAAATRAFAQALLDDVDGRLGDDDD